jgi:hypothetical protein
LTVTAPGLVAGRTERVATMDEMDEAAAQTWAGKP